ncbi:N-formylglutamate amidohydrolase [Mangrovicoccus ximenensis]|uniref:N-formylglutamate amidohydrolase n=1 Tax=Mangrovicoccus ximenensis TaxID=1911570 RepID=UPI000D358A3A|nr:N-formylglutamate amidohydrolase [Mangrovicoccus ximenensis]
MSTASETPLLGAADPSPVLSFPRTGRSPFVFTVDHAGAFVPQALGGLGIDPEALNDHIGIDIGIFPVVSWLSALLGSPMVAQPISRLVIDCNRIPGAATSIPEVSDKRAIPANTGLSQDCKDRRAREILAPYQAEIARMVAERRAALGHAPVLMAMHSFTRMMQGGARRAVDIGVIYHAPDGTANPFAEALIAQLEPSGLTVCRNEPYIVDMANDYTVPEQSVAAGIPHVEIEICQDLISDCRGQRRLAELFWRSLRAVEPQIATLVPQEPPANV